MRIVCCTVKYVVLLLPRRQCIDCMHTGPQCIVCSTLYRKCWIRGLTCTFYTNASAAYRMELRLSLAIMVLRNSSRGTLLYLAAIPHRQMLGIPSTWSIFTYTDNLCSAVCRQLIKFEKIILMLIGNCTYAASGTGLLASAD